MAEKVKEVMELAGEKYLRGNLEDAVSNAKTDILIMFISRGMDLTDEELNYYRTFAKDSGECCVRHMLKRQFKTSY